MEIFLYISAQYVQAFQKYWEQINKETDGDTTDFDIGLMTEFLG